MDYEAWREALFETPPSADPVTHEFPPEIHAIENAVLLDFIDRMLIDEEIHRCYSVEQIGCALNVIFSNSCSNYPFCYLEGSEVNRLALGLRNLRYLYANYFDRYCTNTNIDIGNGFDATIGYVCYMFWDIFVVYPGNAAPSMIDACLEVMENALQSKCEQSIVSALHGLGHWAHETAAGEIVERWLKKPSTRNPVILSYARSAAKGCVQ